MEKYSQDKFWLNDPKILLQKDNWYEIIPSKEMTPNQNLNAITRLAIYLFIIYLLFARSSDGMYLAFIAILVIIIIYLLKYNNKQQVREYMTSETPSKLKKSSKKDSFTEQLFQLSPTCKQDTKYCLRYEDIRHQRPEIDLDISDSESTE